MNNPLFKKISRWILSLSLSFILWYFVAGNSVLIDQKTIDIEYRGLPDNVIMVESLQRVTYSITKNPYYADLVKASVKAFVNIKDTSPGWHTFPIELEITPELPSYIRTNLSVNRARIYLDNKSVKSVSIKPDIDTTNAKDFTISNIHITPSITQITGPESILSKITHLTTDRTSFSRSGEIKVNKKILLPATSISSQDLSVSITFNAIPKYSNRTIPIPITPINRAKGLIIEALSTKEISLRLKGLSSHFDTINSNINGIITVDLADIQKAGIYTKIPIKINLPEGITILNTKNLPANIDVFIKYASQPNIEEDAPEELLKKNEEEEIPFPLIIEKPYLNKEISEQKPIENTIEKKENVEKSFETDTQEQQNTIETNTSEKEDDTSLIIHQENNYGE